MTLSDLTTQCIRCGFCLESCPTFVETGEETQSPRGRIYLVRSAEAGVLDWVEGVGEALDTCLGCRACETSCPSGVKYGEIFELAREEVAKRRPKMATNALLQVITNPMLLKIQRLYPGRKLPGFVSKILSGQEAEVEIPRPQSQLPSKPEINTPAVGSVHFLEGCAMEVLFPAVNESTRRLLRRVGYETLPNSAGCCGALHAHNGQLSTALQMANELDRDMLGGEPLIVNSAGCGSWIKEALKHRVSYDASEFLLEKGLPAMLADSPKANIRIAYHDACHLSHGQGIRSQPRALLEAIPGVTMVRLAESEHCCGSAGIYNVLQPAMARALLERKWKHVEASGADIVAMGNPGCHAWIAQAAREHQSRIRVMHTMEVLEEFGFP